MSSFTSIPDPYPASDFDQWAGHYDVDVCGEGFPFTGYQRVLDEVVRLADTRTGMTVLDLGAGTGNLAAKFMPRGCELWCTDFSESMLELARTRLPSAHCLLHDLRQPFPAALQRRFDRIVSAYVFHHFVLAEKVGLIERILQNLLIPGGRLLIADISFPTQQMLDETRQAAGEYWDEEPYWIAGEALPALEAVGVSVTYQQVSDCAGIYQLSKAE